MSNVLPFSQNVQKFSVDLAYRAVHARLRGYALFLALWLLSRSRHPEGFELTIEEMAVGIGFSTGTVRVALKVLNDEHAFIRDPRVRFRYRWNVDTLHRWLASPAQAGGDDDTKYFRDDCSAFIDADSAELLRTGLPGLVAEELARARVQRYPELAGPAATPEPLKRDERGMRLLSWVEERVRYYGELRGVAARDVVRAIVAAYLGGGSDRLREARHPLAMLLNGGDFNRIDADVPRELRKLTTPPSSAPRIVEPKRVRPADTPPPTEFTPAHARALLDAVGGGAC